MNDPREDGELLWPERYDQKYLDAHRSQLGPLFEAVFQQRPAPLGGRLFKREWFAGRFTTGADFFQLPDGSKHPFCFCPRFAAMDPATGKRATRGDHTVILTAALCPHHNPPTLLILSVRRERMPLDRVVTADPEKNTLAGEIRLWGAQSLDMEDNGFQVTAARLARRFLEVPVREIPTEGKSKLVRALPAIARAESGQILLPRPDPPWAAEFVRELCDWTGDEDDTDDQVDAFTLATKRLDALGAFVPRGKPMKVGERPDEAPEERWDDGERDRRAAFVHERLSPHRRESAASARGLFGSGRRLLG